TRRASDAPSTSVGQFLLHELFERRVAVQPDAPAVIAGARVLTYAELAAAANRLARRLRALGARPERLIAIVMEKGWEQVVAVLGTLTSGAAYVPIDPALPQRRLHSILENAEVELVLTQADVERRTEWPEGLTRVLLDEAVDTEAAATPLSPYVKAHT